MADQHPRLTVGLPVYNGEDYLDETLRAIRGQTFTDFVLFVADNASTDGTRDIVEAHRAEDSRIVVDVADRNRGAAWNWNRCYRGAQSPYFSWACADDIPLPRKFEVCVDLLDDTGPEVVLAYPGTDLIDEHGVVTGHYEDIGPVDEPDPAARLTRIVRDLSLVHPLFGVVRTDVLRSTAGMGAYKRADTVLLGELAMRGRFAFDPAVHFHRRVHPEVSMQGDDASIAAHYTGRADARPTHPFGRLLRGHLTAVRQAPIGAADKARCVAALRRWRYRGRLLDETRSAITGVVTRTRRRLTRN